jgi:hypothetical protein
MYDGETPLLIETRSTAIRSIRRCCPAWAKNPDGSLTIYIQKGAPAKAEEANRLPAPDGPIILVMRLYWPRKTPPSILPPGSGSWSPPPVVRMP